MAKYDQFSMLNLQQIESMAKKLTVAQLKILQIQILPSIKNIDQRN